MGWTMASGLFVKELEPEVEVGEAGMGAMSRELRAKGNGMDGSRLGCTGWLKCSGTKHV